ncbi:MAG: YidH family protein, partial [Pseudorhizobium sp.]
MTDSEERDEGRDNLAEDRTKWAEDRTILSNERTFGGWFRTGMASLGVALGFQALFRASDPTWPVKVGASIFVLIAIAIFWMALISARTVLKRLDPHVVSVPRWRRLLVVTLAATAGALSVLVALWLL